MGKIVYHKLIWICEIAMEIFCSFLDDSNKMANHNEKRETQVQQNQPQGLCDQSDLKNQIDLIHTTNENLMNSGWVIGRVLQVCREIEDLIASSQDQSFFAQEDLAIFEKFGLRQYRRLVQVFIGRE